MSLVVAEPTFRIKFHESLKNKIQEDFIDISNVNLYIFTQFIENNKYDENSIKLLLKLEKSFKATFICLHNGDLFNALKWFDKYREKSYEIIDRFDNQIDKCHVFIYYLINNTNNEYEKKIFNDMFYKKIQLNEFAYKKISDYLMDNYNNIKNYIGILEKFHPDSGYPVCPSCSRFLILQEDDLEYELEPWEMFADVIIEEDYEESREEDEREEVLSIEN